MITKVLIAEDHESANISVQATLDELQIPHTDYVYYCDDALDRIKNSKLRNDPYDLLITDLSFEEDTKAQQLADGAALIEAARKIQPELKVLVFSATREAAVIEKLFNKLDIDGYVRKARNDAKELKQAIAKIAVNQRYFPRHLMELIKQKNTYNFNDFDIAVLSLLARGTRQKDIPEHLQKKQIKPSGLSSVEKRLNQMKEAFGFSTNEQLVAFCIETGVI
ncbi:response regulator [Deminuibacter soli]|uniref:DNA-binding response regulator n=1 Tax=Deminuibacter soli TaxID=2291815 RepID=A0A3E1NFH2_9BACT|nr:response regulator [Deminuibacter soli]RFM26554.1 DNA-binding response regulator [Deminuibacter soli]